MDDHGEDDDEDLAELGWQLFYASFRGQAAEVARLLDLNAPVNFREDELQWTPLLVAADGGHTEVVTLLANRGGDLQARSTLGQTALIYASAEGHLAVVQHLVERKTLFAG